MERCVSRAPGRIAQWLTEACAARVGVGLCDDGRCGQSDDASRVARSRTSEEALLAHEPGLALHTTPSASGDLGVRARPAHDLPGADADARGEDEARGASRSRPRQTRSALESTGSLACPSACTCCGRRRSAAPRASRSAGSLETRLTVPESRLSVPACSGVSTNVPFARPFIEIATRCFAALGPAAATEVSVTAAANATSTAYRAFIACLPC